MAGACEAALGGGACQAARASRGGGLRVRRALRPLRLELVAARVHDAHVQRRYQGQHHGCGVAAGKLWGLWVVGQKVVRLGPMKVVVRVPLQPARAGTAEAGAAEGAEVTSLLWLPCMAACDTAARPGGHAPSKHPGMRAPEGDCVGKHEGRVPAVLHPHALVPAGERGGVEAGGAGANVSGKAGVGCTARTGACTPGAQFCRRPPAAVPAALVSPPAVGGAGAGQSVVLNVIDGLEHEDAACAGLIRQGGGSCYLTGQTLAEGVIRVWSRGRHGRAKASVAQRSGLPAPRPHLIAACPTANASPAQPYVASAVPASAAGQASHHSILRGHGVTHMGPRPRHWAAACQRSAAPGFRGPQQSHLLCRLSQGMPRFLSRRASAP